MCVFLYRRLSLSVSTISNGPPSLYWCLLGIPQSLQVSPSLSGLYWSLPVSLVSTGLPQSPLVSPVSNGLYWSSPVSLVSTGLWSSSPPFSPSLSGLYWSPPASVVSTGLPQSLWSLLVPPQSLWSPPISIGATITLTVW